MNAFYKNDDDAYVVKLNLVIVLTFTSSISLLHCHHCPSVIRYFPLCNRWLLMSGLTLANVFIIMMRSHLVYNTRGEGREEKN